MSIFKRSKDSARPAPADVDAEVEQDSPGEDVDTEVEETTVVVVDRSSGPFDVTEVEGRDGRVDLGALWMRGRTRHGAAPRDRPDAPSRSTPRPP